MKIHEPYRFVMELRKRNGEPLGQIPVAADWEPAVEAARFMALRRFPISTVGTSAVAELLPSWHDTLGQPYIGGVEVGIDIPGSGKLSCRVPNSYFKSLASNASAPLVEKGSLKEGEPFDYLVTAFPNPPTLQAPTPRDRFEVEEAPVSLPLKSSSLEEFLCRSFAFGDQVPGDIPVFIPQGVLAEVEHLTREAAGVETASVLIGHLHRDLASGELFLEITAQIPARNSQASATKVSFGPETWNAVHAAIALRDKAEQWMGWFHSHPAAFWCNPKCPPEARAQCNLQRSFFSADDCAVHRTVFSRAFQIALLVTNTDAGLQPTLFSWRNGVITQRGFHIIGEQKPAFARAAMAIVGDGENENPCT